METVELKTKRLIIRTYLPGDEIQAHEYAGDTSITMMYWLPNNTFEETADYFKSVIEKREKGLTDDLDFATEAAIALRDYAFTKCGVTKLLADCDERNAASANVMKKIGMQCVMDDGTRTYPKTGEVAVEHMYELNKLKEPSFKIVDYFELSAPEQAEIIHQLEIRKDLWGTLPFVIHCLKKEGQPQVSKTDGGFHDLLGPGRFFLMLDEANTTEITVKNKQGGCPRLAAFVSLACNDEVDITVSGREFWTPWIGSVFTYPEYRGRRLSEKLITLAEEYAAREFNAEYTYISTDHIGLYEKYGYEFFYTSRHHSGRADKSFTEED